MATEITITEVPMMEWHNGRMREYTGRPSMTPEVKALLREAAIRKRKANPLLKDLDPLALAAFARDEFDEKVGDPGRTWAYLSRASVAQIAALREFLPHHEVRVGSRVGPRLVYVFELSRLSYALERLGMKWENRRKYVKELHHNWRPS